MAKKPLAAKKASSDAAEPFEESLAELESIVADLEGGDLGLSDALARYEEGVRRLKQCHAQLQAAERRRCRRQPNYHPLRRQRHGRRP